MSLYQNCILSFVHIALYGTFKDHVIFLRHVIMTFYINCSLIGVFLVLTNLYLDLVCIFNMLLLSIFWHLYFVSSINSIGLSLSIFCVLEQLFRFTCLWTNFFKASSSGSFCLRHRLHWIHVVRLYKLHFHRNCLFKISKTV